MHRYLMTAAQDDAKRAGERDRLLLEAQRAGERDRLLLEAQQARAARRPRMNPAAPVRRLARLLFRRVTAYDRGP
jgi:hypothetical protein